MRGTDSVAAILGSRTPKELPIVIAHRGASAVAPENTLAAFRAALQLGAQWIELDVQRSADDVPVVVHDRTYRRTTRLRKRVCDVPVEEATRLDAGRWYGEAFVGERVATLREVLELIAGRANVNVELKGSGSARQRSALIDAVIDVIRETGSERTVLLSSFDHALVSIAHLRAPELARAVIATPGDTRRALTRASTLRASALVIARRQLRRRIVTTAHAAGLAVLVYTVDSPNDVLRCLRAGVDGIFSNDIETTGKTLHAASGTA